MKISKQFNIFWLNGWPLDLLPKRIWFYRPDKITSWDWILWFLWLRIERVSKHWRITALSYKHKTHIVSEQYSRLTVVLALACLGFILCSTAYLVWSAIVAGGTM